MKLQNRLIAIKNQYCWCYSPNFCEFTFVVTNHIRNFNAGGGPEWLNTISLFLSRGHPVYLTVYISMIMFLLFLHRNCFQPKDTADNLKKYGGLSLDTTRENTANYLDYILTRLTVLGAIYLY